MNNDKIIGILDRLYKELKIEKDVDFCRKYGIKANTLSSWKKRNSIPYELIEEISQNENLSMDYIISNKEKSHFENNCELYFLKKLSQKVSAGHGEEYHFEQGSTFPICKNLFKVQINPDEYKVFEVRGKSMSPTLEEEDHVVIKENRAFDGDDLYVIRKGNELFVKKVEKDMDGNCIIKSDNPDYSDITIDKNTDVEHYIIGKVKAILPRI